MDFEANNMHVSKAKGSPKVGKLLAHATPPSKLTKCANA